MMNERLFPECCCECTSFTNIDNPAVYRCEKRIIPPTTKRSCERFEQFDHSTEEVFYFLVKYFLHKLP
jgi:hypothetical protein